MSSSLGTATVREPPEDKRSPYVLTELGVFISNLGESKLLSQQPKHLKGNYYDSQIFESFPRNYKKLSSLMAKTF